MFLDAVQYGVDYFTGFVLGAIAVIIVLTMHTFAKAFAAVKCGDLTPKINGRLSINPLRHFDYIGLLFFVFAGFGWAKPLYINPSNFKKIKSGLVWVSIAGILCDIIMAATAYPLAFLCMRIPLGYFSAAASWLLLNIAICSISYAAFNLIPLPPLDAWQVIDILAKKRGKIFRFFESYGRLILYCLLGFHFIVNIIEKYSIGYAAVLRYIDIFEYFHRFIVGILAYPIQTFWGWIFSLWR